MSSTISALPASAIDQVKVYPEEHQSAVSPPTTALTPTALSSTDVSYVKSLMGVIPAQKMEQILLRTGIPIPAHLGPNIDTSA